MLLPSPAFVSEAEHLRVVHQVLQRLEAEKREQEMLMDHHAQEFLSGIQELEEERDRLRQALVESETARRAQLDPIKLAHLERLERENTEFRCTVEELNHKVGSLVEDRHTVEEIMDGEGKDLRERIERLTRDKEHLNAQMADTLAKVEVGARNAALEEQLRTVTREKESVKDELEVSKGQALLLETKVTLMERKLKLADHKIAALQSEVEVLRRSGRQEVGSY